MLDMTGDIWGDIKRPRAATVTWAGAVLGWGDAGCWEEGLKAGRRLLQVSVNAGSGTDVQDVFLFRSEVEGRKVKEKQNVVSRASNCVPGALGVSATSFLNGF